jgi:hypothetical protein
MRRREIDRDEARVLGVLHDTALAGKGWKRGRVRGWALGGEINDWTGSSTASSYLTRLRAVGLVQGEPAHDPGRAGRPLVLWRITQAGEEAVARWEEREPAKIAPARRDPRDEGVVYIGRRAWQCLAVLQAQPESITWTDLVEQARRRFRDWVYLDDVRMLLNRGLVARESDGTGRSTVIRLRATPRGRRVRLLDGKASPELVQLRTLEPRDDG